MPKVLCKCDHFIDLSEIPSPNQMLMISDIDYDKYWDKIDAEQLFREMTLVAVCPNCGRLYIFNNGFDKPAVIYKEDPL